MSFFQEKVRKCPEKVLRAQTSTLEIVLNFEMLNCEFFSCCIAIPIFFDVLPSSSFDEIVQFDRTLKNGNEKLNRNCAPAASRLRTVFTSNTKCTKMYSSQNRLHFDYSHHSILSLRLLSLQFSSFLLFSNRISTVLLLKELRTVLFAFRRLFLREFTFKLKITSRITCSLATPTSCLHSLITISKSSSSPSNF